MKYATWVLTHMDNVPLFGDHEFTCSNCKNFVFGNSYLTDTGKHFDVCRTANEVMLEYPYCCKCGYKMKRDDQLLRKRRQFEKSCEEYKILYSKSPTPWRVPMPKCRWEVDEQVTKPKGKVPF